MSTLIRNDVATTFVRHRGACSVLLPVHAAKGFGSQQQEKQRPSQKREQGNKTGKTRRTSQVFQLNWAIVASTQCPAKTSYIWLLFLADLQTIKDIVHDSSTKQASKSSVRPVDKSQASKGKLDYVKVQLQTCLVLRINCFYLSIVPKSGSCASSVMQQTAGK